MVLEREQEWREKPAGLEGDIKAFLGLGTEFQGTLTFEGTIRVDGKLSGEVISKDTLIVGEGAEVEAEVNVGVLVSWGRVKGNVKAADRIQLHESSELLGNISTPRLTIAEGALFQGSCEMPQVGERMAHVGSSTWNKPAGEQHEAASPWNEGEEGQQEESSDTSL